MVFPFSGNTVTITGSAFLFSKNITGYVDFIIKAILIGSEDNFQLIGNDKQLLKNNDWIS